MTFEPWQGLIGILITVLGTYAGVRVTTRGTKEQSTASTGAEIIGQLRQQIDEQHRNSASDLAANRAEHERQMAEMRTEEDRRQVEHERKLAAMEAIVSNAIADRRVLQDYVSILRRHIDNGQSPPPPAWPEGLSK